MNSVDELKEEELREAKRTALDNIVWKKIDIWVLPICTIFFLVANLDKRNIAYARVVGLQESLGMSDHQFSLALTASNVTFIISQLPAALLLKRIGPDNLLPTVLSIWGLISASQGFAYNYSGFLTCRVLLGLSEGPLIPGIILYLASFYPPNRLHTRVAIFFSLSLLSSAFSGLLAAAITEMHGIGGRPGWAWIFILEGLITFHFGVLSFFIFPRSAEKVRSLTAEEREYVVATLQRASTLSERNGKDSFGWHEVIEAAKSLHVWLLAVVFFFSGIMMVGLAFFEPSIVASLGYKGNQAQLMSVPPFVLTSAVAFISGIISDRYQCRGYTVIFFCFWKIIGFTMFYASKSRHIRYASLFFSVTGVSCVAPALIAWLTNNSAPHTRRASAVAVTVVLTELGGILGPWLFGPLSPPPDYTLATIVVLAMSVGTLLVSVANLAHLRRQNRLKAEKRQWMRKEEEPEGLGDRSAWFVYSL